MESRSNRSIEENEISSLDDCVAMRVARRRKSSTPFAHSGERKRSKSPAPTPTGASRPKFDKHMDSFIRTAYSNDDDLGGFLNDFFTDFIPNYISGSKGLSSDTFGIAYLCGIFWIAYFIWVFYCVMIRLNFYYIMNGSHELLIKDLQIHERYFIAASYLLIDAMYPISFVLLYYFYKSGLIKKYKRQLVAELGHDAFLKSQDYILSVYVWGLVYVFAHCGLLFCLLYWPYDYPLEDATFWAFKFGFPHALHPVLLACHIFHVIKLYDIRLQSFKDDVVNMSYDDANELWDTFQRCRDEANKLGEELSHFISWFGLSLLASVLMQGTAVFVFKGQWFSLIYLNTNIWVLLFVMYQSRAIPKEFGDFCEAIINFPARDENKNPTILGTVSIQTHTVSFLYKLYPLFIY